MHASLETKNMNLHKTSPSKSQALTYFPQRESARPIRWRQTRQSKAANPSSSTQADCAGCQGPRWD